MANKQSIYDLATPGVQDLVPYLPGKPIIELERELGLKQIVKLASNENPLGPSANVIKALQSVMPDLARYPDGNGFGLKQVLAKKLKVNSNQITLGNGSNEILELVARTFVDTESEVIISQHAFAVYPLVTKAIGASSNIVPALNFGHDLEAMLRRVSEQTALVFIANPNNPTGTYLKSEPLKQFLRDLPKSVICVIDEAYFEYVRELDYPDTIEWLAEYPNLLITRTFSKAYGLAGLRIGYGISSPEMADLLNRVRQPFNCNAMALAAAEAALDDQDHLQKSINMNEQGMQQLTRAFVDMGLEWVPSAGNFVTVNMKRPGLPVYESLLKLGVIVRPVANYELPDFLRISIGTENENRFFIHALGNVLGDV